MDIQKAMMETTNSGIKALLQSHLDSLKLYKLQNIRQVLNLDIVRQDVADLKTFTEKQIDERLPLVQLRNWYRS